MLLDLTFEKMINKLITALKTLNISSTVNAPVNLVRIELIKGIDGVNGKSAFEIWQELGNLGTEQDFINNLVKNTQYKELLITNEMIETNTNFYLRNVKVGEIYKLSNGVSEFDRININIEGYTCVNYNYSIFQLYYLKRSYNINDYITIEILNDNKFKVLDYDYTIEYLSNLSNGLMSLVGNYKNNIITGYIIVGNHKVDLVSDKGLFKIYKLRYNTDSINFISGDIYFNKPKQIYKMCEGSSIFDVKHYYDSVSHKSNYYIYSFDELIEANFEMSIHNKY